MNYWERSVWYPKKICLFSDWKFLPFHFSTNGAIVLSSSEWCLKYMHVHSCEMTAFCGNKWRWNRCHSHFWLLMSIWRAYWWNSFLRLRMSQKIPLSKSSLYFFHSKFQTEITNKYEIFHRQKSFRKLPFFHLIA